MLSDYSKSYEVPCDLVNVCSQTTVTFICSFNNNQLSWFVPDILGGCDPTPSEPLCRLQHLYFFSSTHSIKIGIVNALLDEQSNSTYMLSRLTFVVPNKLNVGNVAERIFCTTGTSSSDDGKSCYFQLQG